MILQTRIGELLRAIQALNENDAWRYAVTKQVLDEIIRLNTEHQLEEQGIDSIGRELGDYSPYTMIIKRLKGQRTDHITLKDTGEFYDSFTATVNNTEIILGADGLKDDGTDLFREYGAEVLGLTEENIQYIIEDVKQGYIDYVNSVLFGN
jgi:hypothetical protein